MGGLSIVTQISSVLGLLGLIAFIAMKFFTSNKPVLSDPKLLRELLDTGIPKEKIKELDFDKIKIILESHGRNVENLSRDIFRPALKHQANATFVFAFLMFAIAAIGLSIDIIKEDNLDSSLENQCKSYTIKGRIIDEENSSPMVGLKISPENVSAMEENTTLENGTFFLTGLTLPKSKLLRLIIKGKNINIRKDFDLSNSDKYFTENCTIDLATIGISIAKNRVKPQISGSGADTFDLTPYELGLKKAIEQSTKLKYSRKGLIKITIGYTGNFHPANDSESLFYFSGGEAELYVNGELCHRFKDLVLDGTPRFGNRLNDTKSAVEQKLIELIKVNLQSIITSLKLCL